LICELNIIFSPCGPKNTIFFFHWTGVVVVGSGKQCQCTSHVFHSAQHVVMKRMCSRSTPFIFSSCRMYFGNPKIYPAHGNSCCGHNQHGEDTHETTTWTHRRTIGFQMMWKLITGYFAYKPVDRILYSRFYLIYTLVLLQLEYCFIGLKLDSPLLWDIHNSYPAFCTLHSDFDNIPSPGTVKHSWSTSLLWARQDTTPLYARLQFIQSWRDYLLWLLRLT
jgi:hypothetical protein